MEGGWWDSAHHGTEETWQGCVAQTNTLHRSGFEFPLLYILIILIMFERTDSVSSGGQEWPHHYVEGWED